jgi:hypothetical protein
VAEQEKIRVKISYAPDRERIGTIEEHPRAQASVLVSEGRAVYVDASGNRLEQPDRSGGAERPATERAVLTPSPAEGNAASPSGRPVDRQPGADASGSVKGR